ncbi:LysR family transcriptional regulator, partial [Streptomyces sp. McG5]|nr:LysR family transcriptional regulator [Streptomyces sp. McG5]
MTHQHSSQRRLSQNSNAQDIPVTAATSPGATGSTPAT